MTTNSTMSDLERRAGFAVWGIIRASDQVCLEVARAALKAHAEWLEEQGLEIKPKVVTKDALQNVLGRMSAALQQEDQSHD